MNLPTNNRSNFALNQCTEDELKTWRAAAEECGFKTLNRFLYECLKGFKDLGMEKTTGNKNVNLTSYDYTGFDIKKPVSRRIRKFINTIVKEHNDERTNQLQRTE